MHCFYMLLQMLAHTTPQRICGFYKASSGTIKKKKFFCKNTDTYASWWGWYKILSGMYDNSNYSNYSCSLRLCNKSI